MSKYPLKGISKKTALREVEDRGSTEVATPAPRSGAFFSFRYSYTEVWSQGSRTRINTRQARLEDGKLSTEAFEGEVDGNVYGEVMRLAQQQLLGQATWLLRSMSWLLPPLRGTRPDRD